MTKMTPYVHLGNVTDVITPRTKGWANPRLIPLTWISYRLLMPHTMSYRTWEMADAMGPAGDVIRFMYHSRGVRPT